MTDMLIGAGLCIAVEIILSIIIVLLLVRNASPMESSEGIFAQHSEKVHAESLNSQKTYNLELQHTISVLERDLETSHKLYNNLLAKIERGKND